MEAGKLASILAHFSPEADLGATSGPNIISSVWAFTEG